jgi:hypothetical protein
MNPKPYHRSISILALALAFTLPAVAEDKPAAKESPQYLFVHSASAMTSGDGKITLKKVNDHQRAACDTCSHFDCQNPGAASQ